MIVGMKTKPMACGFLVVFFAFSAGWVARGATIIVQMHKVLGTNYVFDPTNITINLGDTVKWTNTVFGLQHDSTHSPADGDPRLWHSPLLNSTPPNNTYSFTFTSPGVYSYLCQNHFYTGNPEEVGTVTVIAPNLPPTVNIISPANGTPFFAPAKFTIQAEANDTDGSVAQVQFFRGTVSLGVSTTNPYSNNVSFPVGGTYALTVVATDDQGAKATSSVVSVTVTAPPTISAASVERLSDGRFHFQIRGGNAGQTCIIDACQSLPNWTPVFTNTFTNTACAFCPFVDFIDSETNRDRRFYRSRVFP